MSVSVCPCASFSTSMFSEPHVESSPSCSCMSPVAVARSNFMDDVTFLLNGQEYATRKRRIGPTQSGPLGTYGTRPGRSLLSTTVSFRLGQFTLVLHAVFRFLVG